MLKIILLLNLFIFSNILYSQTVLEIVTSKENFIVSNKKLNWQDYINKLYYEDISEFIDMKTFNEFKNVNLENKENLWKINDFELPIYLVNDVQKLDLKTIEKINNERCLDVFFKKSIKKYNNGNQFYRNFPIAISNVLYNIPKNKALVVISRGNNGGEIKYFELKEEKWIFKTNIVSWAY